MTELKPCPFCGGQALETAYPEDHVYTVMCRDCYIETFPYLTTEEADRAWNRRVEE